MKSIASNPKEFCEKMGFKMASGGLGKGKRKTWDSQRASGQATEDDDIEDDDDDIINLIGQKQKEDNNELCFDGSPKSLKTDGKLPRTKK